MVLSPMTEKCIVAHLDAISFDRNLSHYDIYNPIVASKIELNRKATIQLVLNILPLGVSLRGNFVDVVFVMSSWHSPANRLAKS